MLRWSRRRGFGTHWPSPCYPISANTTRNRASLARDPSRRQHPSSGPPLLTFLWHTVSLAGDDHGTCKLTPILLLSSMPPVRDTIPDTCPLTRTGRRTDLLTSSSIPSSPDKVADHGPHRVTPHTRAVSSSSQSTSQQTTHSSLPRSTSPPASTTPTSTAMEASAWTFCETSGPQP